jgi:uncharacterized protein (UPF0332 family)
MYNYSFLTQVYVSMFIGPTILYFSIAYYTLSYVALTLLLWKINPRKHNVFGLYDGLSCGLL